MSDWDVITQYEQSGGTSLRKFVLVFGWIEMIDLFLLFLAYWKYIVWRKYICVSNVCDEEQITENVETSRGRGKANKGTDQRRRRRLDDNFINTNRISLRDA